MSDTCSHAHDIYDSEMDGSVSVWPCGYSAAWTTMTSHPASGLRYQEAAVDGETYGRVLHCCREVVNPSPELHVVNAQYNSRVVRYIGE